MEFHFTLSICTFLSTLPDRKKHFWGAETDFLFWLDESRVTFQNLVVCTYLCTCWCCVSSHELSPSITNKYQFQWLYPCALPERYWHDPLVLMSFPFPDIGLTRYNFYFCQVLQFFQWFSFSASLQCVYYFIRPLISFQICHFTNDQCYRKS